MAVMNLIEGPNLKQAVEAGVLKEWDQVLRIATRLARIIRDAHSLPERVLHRDLRPSNVMLENFWTEPSDWRVVVLDFDLSWHRDAFEKSVVSTQATSYMAPEQLSGGVPTRNAAVDSFGLGMTLLYMVRGSDPASLEHLHKQWSQNLRVLAKDHPSDPWRSLSMRFMRVIENATRNAQKERWDVAQIKNELDRLASAYSDPDSVDSAELLAEELIARSGCEYEWRPDTVAAVARLPSGVEVIVKASEPRRDITVELKWASAGMEDRRNVGKWVPKAFERAAAALRKGEWKDVNVAAESQSGSVGATVDSRFAVRRLNALSEGIRAASQVLRFE